jgi:hypothetical protein
MQKFFLQNFFKLFLKTFSFKLFSSKFSFSPNIFLKNFSEKFLSEKTKNIKKKKNTVRGSTID